MFVFLSENLKDPKTLSPASSAISELCSYNKKFVIENIDDFLTCKSILNSINLTIFYSVYEHMYNNDQIVGGLAKAISAQSDYKSLEKYLEKLCQPFATSLLLILDRGEYQNVKHIIRTFCLI